MSWKIRSAPTLTSKEAVDRFFSEGNGPFFPTEGKDRLWGHDFIHTLLGAKLSTSRAEELAGIYQAVLLNDPDVNKLNTQWRDAKIPLTLDMVKQQIVPSLRGFVNDLATRLGRKSTPALSDDEIAEHFVRARTLSRLVYEEFGHNLGEMRVEEIKVIPFKRFEKLLEQANAIYDGRHGRQPFDFNSGLTR